MASVAMSIYHDSCYYSEDNCKKLLIWMIHIYTYSETPFRNSLMFSLTHSKFNNFKNQKHNCMFINYHLSLWLNY